MSNSLQTIAYITASVLLILSLGGLANQETARRGNVYGIAGMAIAFIATALGGSFTGYTTLLGAILPAVLIGSFLASRVAMTSMPELVAILHSFCRFSCGFGRGCQLPRPRNGVNGIGSLYSPD